MMKDFVKINGRSITDSSFGRTMFITNVDIQQSEKKKVLVDVPFSNGSIDLSYTFANENFFKDVGLSFTVTVYAKNQVSRTASNKLADILKNQIIPVVGTMEIETSNYIGRRFICTHISTTSTHRALDDLMDITFNFLAKPYAIEKVGGLGYCDIFEEMYSGDCASTSYHVTPVIANKLYTLNFKHPVPKIVDLLIETDSKLITVNGKDYAVTNNSVIIPKRDLQTRNNISSKTACLYLYTSYDRLIYF